MQVDDGGWQLVASVHEDNIGAKCNAGDLWTNTNGNSGRGNKGLGHWQNVCDRLRKGFDP
jgi:intelectin